MLAQAWGLERTGSGSEEQIRGWESRAAVQSGARRPGVIKLPLTGFWDSVGTKKTPRTFLREIPQPGVEEACGCESQF